MGTLETFETAEWADTEDENKKREFVQLLNFCLQERTWLLGLRRYKKDKRIYYYFPATKTLKVHKEWYRSVKRRASREVFKQYSKKSDAKQRAYCRHAAFKGFFLRLGDEWYLEITPTYHFTSDGYTESRFRAEWLQGIKRLERNPAVVGQLLMWADLLKRPIRSLFATEYPFLSFGDLMTLDINTSLPDEVWYQAEEKEEALGDKENQPGLLGL